MHTLSLPLHSTNDPTRDQSLEAELLDETFVDDLIRSHNAASRGYSTAFFAHQEDRCIFSLLEQSTESDQQSSPYHMDFQITSPTGVLELKSPISNCAVATEHWAILQHSNGEVELGPGVLLFASELEIRGDTFSAFGGGEDRPNIIVTSATQHSPKLRVRAHPPEVLQVLWPDTWHQWKPYLAKMPPRESNVSYELAWRIMLSTRRILASFRSSVQADPSIYHEMLERLIVGNNPVFAATLKGLLEVDVVVRDGALYRLRLEKLRIYRVSWSDVGGPNFAKALKTLHADVCDTEPVRALAKTWRE